MVTSDFRPEVEIQPFLACAMHPAIIGTVRSLLTWLWGRYHVSQNVFLVIDLFESYSTTIIYMSPEILGLLRILEYLHEKRSCKAHRSENGDCVFQKRKDHGKIKAFDSRRAALERHAISLRELSCLYLLEPPRR